MARQINLDRRADADLGIDFHVTAGLTDEAIDLAETKAGSLADFLGRVERVECPHQNIGRHSRSRIGDGEKHVLPRRDRIFLGESIVHIGIRCLDRQLAAVRHRVARIDRKVDDSIFKLNAVGQDLPKASREHSLYIDGLAKRAIEKIAHARHQAVGAERLRRKRLLPRKRQQPLRERGRALRALDCAIGKTFNIGFALGQFPLHQRQTAKDHRKHVVEVVRDATRQLSNGFHLLDLPKLLLRPRPLKHLLEDALFQCRVQGLQCAFRVASLGDLAFGRLKQPPIVDGGRS